MAEHSDKTCAICLEDARDPLDLPCGHSFCDVCLDQWRSRYGVTEEMRGKCPICRARIPPSKEMTDVILSYRNIKQMLEDNNQTSSESYDFLCQALAQNVERVGEDRDGVTVLHDNNDKQTLRMPDFIWKAIQKPFIKTVLKWINANPTEDRVNAISRPGLMAYVDIRDSQGATAIALVVAGQSSAFVLVGQTPAATRGAVNKMAKLLLSWGATFIHDGDERKHRLSIAREWGYHKLADLLESKLGGRRCKIVNLSARPELNGKTCVADEYLPDSNEYTVTLETKSKDVLILSPDNLKRRDRTPRDCGYYIEFKNGRTIRHDFDSNEDCQAFVAALNRDETQPAVTEEAEARAEQAAAELLAELGLDDIPEKSPSGGQVKKAKKRKVDKKKRKN
ncbi:hypothetical protein THAOC_00415 [Thalassiosira oceanica]|uniref:RING-type domain-containing protein n=1 Tax=Thalassiosira oceanica TaxID=159749 RepID=K0TGA8_THAOC|nr:hypothetical protein THAOC_00415 [Thalassiosira oceanica]|eukprot:EJK77733.1 hypothetical protein THAOC_00415 [Thalassiosira oceanica]